MKKILATLLATTSLLAGNLFAGGNSDNDWKIGTPSSTAAKTFTWDTGDGATGNPKMSVSDTRGLKIYMDNASEYLTLGPSGLVQFGIGGSGTPVSSFQVYGNGNPFTPNFRSMTTNQGVKLVLQTGATATTADAQLTFDNNSVTWSIGDDTSDSNALVISNSNTLGTTNKLRLASTGDLGIYGTLVQTNYDQTAATDTAYAQKLNEGSVSFSGGTGASSGRTMKAYGGSHATKSMVLEFTRNSTIDGQVNGSGAWQLGQTGSTQTHLSEGNFQIQRVGSVGGLAPTTSQLLKVSNVGAFSLTGTSQFSIYVEPDLNSAATVAGYGVYVQPRTQATAFTVPHIASFYGAPIAKGAGSSITRATTFYAGAGTGNGANSAQIANNTSYSGDYFLNFTGDFPSLLGRLGLGTVDGGTALYVAPNNMFLSGANGAGVYVEGAVNSGVTTSLRSFVANINTSPTAYTVGEVTHYYAANSAKGAGSTITRMRSFGGVFPTQATNNAFLADSNTFTGDWFIYGANNKPSIISGRFEIGSAGSSTDRLLNLQMQTGIVDTSTVIYGVSHNGSFPATATNTAYNYFAGASTSAAAYTLGNLYGYFAQNQTKGAGSTITRQIQFGGQTPTNGSQNAFLSDNAGFVGSYFIHSTSNNPTVMSGAFTIGDSTYANTMNTIRTSNANTTSSGVAFDCGSAGCTTAIHHGRADGILTIGGSGAINNGPLIQMYGSSHATSANQLRLSSGGTGGIPVILWSDPTGVSMTVGGGIVYSDSRMAVYGDNNTNTNANQKLLRVAANGWGTSSATGQQVWLWLDGNMNNAPTYTTSYVAGMVLKALVKGTNQTVTDLIGVAIEDQTESATRFKANLSIGNNGSSPGSTGASGTYNIYVEPNKASHIGGNVELGVSSITANSHTIYGNVTQTKNVNASSMNYFINNTGTGAGSDASMLVQVVGGGSGKAIVRVGSSGTENVSMMYDDGAARFRMMAANNGIYLMDYAQDGANKYLGIMGDLNSAAYLTIGQNGGNSVGVAGTDVIVVLSKATYKAANSGYGASFQAASTTAASQTMTTRYGFMNLNQAKGSGSTITRDIAFGGTMPNQGTSNSFLADNTTFTNNLAISIASSNGISVTGNIAVGSNDWLSSNGVFRGSDSAVTAGASQFSFVDTHTFSSSATTLIAPFYAAGASANSVFTTPDVNMFHATTFNKGASHTITRLSNFFGVPQSAGTSNAFMADDGSYSSNYTLYFVTNRPSSHAGDFSVVRQQSGGSVALTVQNNSNTASSDAYQMISVAGSSAGNPYTRWEISGVQSWVAGSVNSASDAWKLVEGANITTSANDRIIVSAGSGGHVTWKASSDNSDAAAGFNGEFIRSAVGAGSPVTAGATGVFKDITSISLTAGDWDVSGIPSCTIGTGTGISNCLGAISVNSGATITDHSRGDNESNCLPPTSTYDVTCPIPSYRLKLSSTTTVYLKGRVGYTGGTPNIFGRISARRVR